MKWEAHLIEVLRPHRRRELDRMFVKAIVILLQTLASFCAIKAPIQVAGQVLLWLFFWDATTRAEPPKAWFGPHREASRRGLIADHPASVPPVLGHSLLGCCVSAHCQDNSMHAFKHLHMPDTAGNQKVMQALRKFVIYGEGSFFASSPALLVLPSCSPSFPPSKHARVAQLW